MQLATSDELDVNKSVRNSPAFVVDFSKDRTDAGKQIITKFRYRKLEKPG